MGECRYGPPEAHAGDRAAGLRQLISSLEMEPAIGARIEWSNRHDLRSVLDDRTPYHVEHQHLVSHSAQIAAA